MASHKLKLNTPIGWAQAADNGLGRSKCMVTYSFKSKIHLEYLNLICGI
jgi:hypothetical protein